MAPFDNWLCCALTGLNCCQNNHSVSSVRVNLDHAVYEGTRLPNGIDQFLGIRYAAAPLGDLRWRKPQDPPAQDDVQNANYASSISIIPNHL